MRGVCAHATAFDLFQNQQKKVLEKLQKKEVFTRTSRVEPIPSVTPHPMRLSTTPTAGRATRISATAEKPA